MDIIIIIFYICHVYKIVACQIPNWNIRHAHTTQIPNWDIRYAHTTHISNWNIRHAHTTQIRITRTVTRTIKRSNKTSEMMTYPRKPLLTRGIFHFCDPGLPHCLWAGPPPLFMGGAGV